MRVPWTARSNQSVLKEISPGCSLEGLMLKLKLHHSDHLMQRSSSHKRLQALVFGILFLSQSHSLCFLEFSSFSPGISQLVHLPSVLWSPPIRTGAPAKPSPPQSLSVAQASTWPDHLPPLPSAAFLQAVLCYIQDLSFPTRD